MKINFIIERTPVSSPRPRFVAKPYPHAYMDPNYLKEKDDIATQFIDTFGTLFESYQEPVKIRIKFFIPMAKAFKGFTGKKAEIVKDRFNGTRCDAKKDLDNLAKTILDALLHIAYVDDKQITYLETEKYWTKDEIGRTEVEIEYEDIDSIKEIDSVSLRKEQELYNDIDFIYNNLKPTKSQKLKK